MEDFLIPSITLPARSTAGKGPPEQDEFDVTPLSPWGADTALDARLRRLVATVLLCSVVSILAMSYRPRLQVRPLGTSLPQRLAHSRLFIAKNTTDNW